MTHHRIVTFLCLAAILLCGFVAQAQSSNKVFVEQMKKLNFLVGEWQGEGWIERGANQHATFKGTESVQRKAGGTALVVEGVHRARVGNNAEESVIHNALAVISWDEKTQLYHFRSNLADGRYTDAEAKFVDGALVWSFKQNERVSIRFTIRLNQAGEWFEIGEMSFDGTNWKKFFEMTMRRTR